MKEKMSIELSICIKTCLQKLHTYMSVLLIFIIKIIPNDIKKTNKKRQTITTHQTIHSDSQQLSNCFNSKT